MNVNYLIRVSCGLIFVFVIRGLCFRVLGSSILGRHNLALTQGLNYESLQTKANFPLGEREDLHERKSNGSCKIAYRPNFKLVLCLREN